MATVHPGTIADQVRPIMASIRTTAVPVSERVGEEHHPPSPFITISRQAGAGAWTLAQRLVDQLNSVESGEPPWTGWDRELVEKVAADHRIAAELVESLEDATHSWMGDLFAGLSFTEHPELADEARVYNRVATTIRALAQAGHVVIVGRGGVLITRNMPGGIHIRLIAPLDYRIANMARQFKCTKESARSWVHQMDRNRQQFYRRYWAGTPLTDETFALTLNAGLLSEEQMIRCILPLAKQVPHLAAKGHESCG